MALLNGKGSYRGFRGGSKETPPQLAVAWAPPGELTATTDGSRKGTGTLTFRPGVALTISGALTPA
jgi:hypothetical protein